MDLPVLAALLDEPGDLASPPTQLLGDRICCSGARTCFSGIPALPWHEDRYAGLFVREAFSVSLMLAIEDSPPDNCTMFALGSHRLTTPEKERRYGIEARPQASGNVRYAGPIAAEHHEFLSLKAGEMIVFHPRLLHASSGYVNGRTEASAARMSITFRVATPDANLRDEAFADGVGDGNAVLRAIARTSNAAG